MEKNHSELVSTVVTVFTLAFLFILLSATPMLAVDYNQGYAVSYLINSELDHSYQLNKEEIRLDFGLEIDVLPYITGGYYFSSWVGSENFRLRGVLSKLSMPEFVLPNNFSAWEMEVLAVILDYFPAKTGKYQGPWIGVGYEYWESEIEIKKSKRSGELSHNIFTFGGGYIYKFSEHFYLNLWGAGHYVLSGKELVVDGESYKIPSFQGEISLKFG